MESGFSSRRSCCSTSATGAGSVWALVFPQQQQLKWTVAALCLLVYFLYACSFVFIPADHYPDHDHHRDGAVADAVLLADRHSSKNSELWRMSTTSSARRGVYQLLTADTKFLPWQQDHQLLDRRAGAASESAIDGDDNSSSSREQLDQSTVAAGKKIEAAAAGASAAIRMKLVHRNAAESPFRKEYPSPAEALEEALHMDAVRHAGFRKRILLATATATAAENDDSELENSSEELGHAAAGGAVDPAPTSSAAATTTVLQKPPSEQSFYSPVVSGATLGSGQYFVNFSIGTPAQSFSLIADTGSDLIWLQCATCTLCYAQDGPLYSPASSSSFAPVPCSSDECNLVPASPGFPCFSSSDACAYQYQYADSSTTKGIFAFETATLISSSNSSSSSSSGGSSSVRIENVAFGCGTENQVSFQGAGGVMGLGQGPLSFTSQIGYAYGNKFSYCLVKFSEPVSVSSSLIFGDDAVLFTKHALQYTPILDNARSGTLYYVGVEDVSVAGAVLDIPSSAWSFNTLGDGGTIVDSGSTLSYFVPEAYSAILLAFQQALLPLYPQVLTRTQTQTSQQQQSSSPQSLLDLCFNVSGFEDPEYPDFKIRFRGGAEFAPPWENYIVEVARDVKCLAMQGLQSGFGGFNTLGNLLQQNFLVVYDRQNSRIGFSRSSCASLQN